MEATPTIYSPRIPHVHLSIFARSLALLISLACLAVLLCAASITPDPSGMGTHTQLNMPPCLFAAQTGIPCPTCGMTTSFAWFARGNLLASFYVQPMGTVLAILAVITFWMGIYIALTGRAAHRLVKFIPGKYLVVPLVSWGIAAWAWKIFIHLHGIDGWRS